MSRAARGFFYAYGNRVGRRLDRKMVISNETSGQAVIEEWNSVVIRPARMGDIEDLLDLHVQAFCDKFRAAFGLQHVDQGRAAFALAYRMQGERGLAGMYLAMIGTHTVGTITLRTREMNAENSPAVERAFHQILGTWGSFRAVFALSRLDHTIGWDEGYITDVAVHERYRRRGIARSMLEYVAKQAQARHKRYLGLYVSAGNVAARQLYLSEGFTEERVRHSWWNRWLLGESRWIYMRKVLP